MDHEIEAAQGGQAYSIDFELTDFGKQRLKTLRREEIVEPGPGFITSREDAKVGVATLVSGSRADDSSNRDSFRCATGNGG